MTTAKADHVSIAQRFRNGWRQYQTFLIRHDRQIFPIAVFLLAMSLLTTAFTLGMIIAS